MRTVTLSIALSGAVAEGLIASGAVQPGNSIVDPRLVERILAAIYQAVPVSVTKAEVKRRSTVHAAVSST